MEPLTLATSFATIVGLLNVFKSQADAREAKDLNQFLDWLQRHRHDQLVNLIQDNQQLAASLVPLIEGQHEEVMAQLARLNDLLSSLARHVAGFTPLVEASHSATMISDQAVSILHQMNAARASRCLEIRSQGGIVYEMLDGTHGRLTITDERFIEDDLATLCEFGLLRLDYNATGGRIFIITRAGASLAE